MRNIKCFQLSIMHSENLERKKITDGNIFYVEGNNVMREGAEESADPTAESDAITNRKHTDLNPRVHSQSLIEFQHKVPVVPHILPQRCIWWGHHRPIPQCIIIPNYSSYFHQIYQPLVIIQIVVLVSIHEYEIIATMIFFLKNSPYPSY